MSMLAFYAALATQIIAGFLVIFGFFTAYATLVLITFTLGATFTYHRFWALAPGIERTLNTIIFIGNLSITLVTLLFVLSYSL